MLIGIGAYFFVADFPADVHWLSPEEKEFVIARTQTEERSASSITMQNIGAFFTDVKNLIAPFVYFGKCRI